MAESAPTAPSADGAAAARCDGGAGRRLGRAAEGRLGAGLQPQVATCGSRAGAWPGRRSVNDGAFSVLQWPADEDRGVAQQVPGAEGAVAFCASDWAAPSGALVQFSSVQV